MEAHLIPALSHLTKVALPMQTPWLVLAELKPSALFRWVVSLFPPEIDSTGSYVPFLCLNEWGNWSLSYPWKTEPLVHDLKATWFVVKVFNRHYRDVNLLTQAFHKWFLPCQERPPSPGKQESPGVTPPRTNDERRRSGRTSLASSGSKFLYETDIPKKAGRKSGNLPAKRASISRSQHGILQMICSKRRSGASEANLIG